MITREEIEQVLDEKVRPDLAIHGGNIMIVDLKDSTLSVRLTGNCSGCLSADLTMETLIRTELKGAFPELTHIELVTGVSDDIILEALKILKKKGSSLKENDKC